MKAIAAMSSNRVIGRDGRLPWHLPEDLRWFKELTTGGVLLMGRRTWDSLLTGLPHRGNIVISRRMKPIRNKRTLVADDIGEVEPMSQLVPPEIYGKLWVIGGASIYAQLLPLCTDLYLTYIYDPYEGDTLMPEFEHLFSKFTVIRKNDQFEIRHYTK